MARYDRDDIVERLKLDLIGPDSVDETLEDRPQMFT